MDEPVQYLTAESLKLLKEERQKLKGQTIPDIAKRIDEAKQQGDLSENAEYHQAREDMSWAKGRLIELEQIINNAHIITSQNNGMVSVGNTVKVKVNGKEKDYTIVGPQEANPMQGKISNESPLGSAFIGHKIDDTVEVSAPSGKQKYQILEIK